MPAPAVITCPLCQNRFRGKPELGGKRIKCPSCAKPFVVPNEDAPRPKRTKSDVEPPADDMTYGIGRIDTAPRCPHCAAEMLGADAIICVQCGYNTLTREHGKTKKLISATPREHFLYLLPSLSAALIFVLLVIGMTFYDTVLPQWLAASNWSWITHESLRMWTTIVLLAILWGIGSFAFKTLVLHPMPPEEEKE